MADRAILRRAVRAVDDTVLCLAVFFFPRAGYAQLLAWPKTVAFMTENGAIVWYVLRFITYQVQ